MESRKSLLWVFLVWLTLLEGWCDGCLEQEKAALLHLKPFFYDIEDLDHWVEGTQCCGWKRVECNATTGRVIHLFLNQSTSGIYFRPVIVELLSNRITSRAEWYLNASLFLPFQELKSLYLSGNSIAGCLHNQGFERLSSELDKLEILDLSDNHLSDSILSSLSELSSLKSLYLGDNSFIESNVTMNGIKKLSKLRNLETLHLHNIRLGNNILSQLDGFTSLKTLNLDDCGLKGTLHMMEFNKLMNLKELYLSNNEIESFQFFQGKEEFNLTKLEVLSLDGNSFNNSVFSSLDALPNLKSLYIRDNPLLTGLIDVKEHGLMNLEVLDLWGTYFDDNNILPFLNRLSNLKTLSFELEGNLNGSTFEKSTLSNLEDLDISCYSESEYVSGLKACSLPLQSLGMLSSSLKTLSLSGFSFNGTMSQKWQNMTNLEELYLSDSSLPSNFLQVIGTMTSLRVWDMSYCRIDGNLSIHERQNMTNLEELYLSDSSLPSNFLQVIGTMTSLRVWDMSSCTIDGNLSIHGPLLHLKNLESMDIESTPMGNNFLQTIGSMPSLNSLRLYDCGLSGTLPTQGFICESRNLQRLFIGYSNLTGILPEYFSNLTSLDTLSLISNQFSGNISVLQSLTSLESLVLDSNQFSGDISALKNLTSLQELSLSNNYFQIPSSLGPLFNLSKLRSISADNNIIKAEMEMPSQPPRFQLEAISFSCCGDVGSFPHFLYHQNNLLSVDMSNIHFKGDQFPNWLLQNNSKLERLILSNSSLSGPLQLPFAPHLDLSELDISNNLFICSIPTEMGAQLPSLSSLNMSKNYFNGSIPSSFGDMRLLTLDLSNNQLSGGIPEHLVMGCSSLEVLVLSNNTLQGQIFYGSFNLTSLTVLLLDGNHFSGMIPDFLSNSSGLSKLDVSNNKLSGRIPRGMGNMSSLEEIILANNHLEGTIPVEFCQLYNLALLDLSGNNNICGNLPSCFSPLNIRQLHLSKNRLQGGLNALRNSSTLVTLDISNNQFSGNIPSWIGGLTKLSFLLFSKNHFKGKIPIELCNLTRLSLINLSHNNFSGHIPPCLKLTSLDDVSEYFYSAIIRTPSLSIKFPTDEAIEFPTKHVSYTYRGRILQFMSGIDLSCNNLVGQIPYEIGNFRNILVLNLSHNGFTGPIPLTFSNLTQIESLDLSYNHLRGNIPPQLVGLHNLAFFNVSYNNLSGKTPQWIAQFGTFDESSYRGNPFLCGEPLPRCSNTEPLPPLLPEALSDNGPIDMGVFYVSFVVSYTILLLAIAIVLYINPYWRRAWFYRVETGINSCYYFVVDNILPRQFRC